MNAPMQPVTRIDEIAPDVFRISTPVPPDVVPGGFTFNQYLIRDEQPLLFHTGPRKLFGFIRDAIGRVMPVSKLRYVAFSHFEADECGSLNHWLAVAPDAVPACGQIAAMVSIGDYADRPPQALAHGAQLVLGRRTVKWLDAPHVPHGWDCGYMVETSTRTMFSGDLFTQFGAVHPALTSDDILEPSEAARVAMDYYAHGTETKTVIERLAAENPVTLACMHGPAWSGNGAALLRELGSRLGATALRAA
ncbi:MAG: MBL fold metallo-hydrolase [Bacteroidota bacterium]